MDRNRVAESHHPKHPPNSCVRENGWRDTTVETYVNVIDGVVLISERSGKSPVVNLELDPEGVEWLLELLEHNHPDDRVTDHLRYARQLAKECLWKAESE